MHKTLTTVKRIATVFLPILFVIYFPHTSFADQVTDETGRNVNISSSPKRIVSLAPGITEILYALGLDDKIVGVTNYCNWPRAARQKQQIGGFINPSIEQIVSLKPDVIIATADGNRLDTIDSSKELVCRYM
jgi:iron complex transport system substrate-binding protein